MLYLRGQFNFKNPEMQFPPARGFLGGATAVSSTQKESNKLDCSPHQLRTHHQRLISDSASVLAELGQRQRCGNCNQLYLRRTNIGNWNCRWHPDPGYASQVHTCCNSPRNPFAVGGGCQRCDHIPVHARSWNETPTQLEIPLSLIEHLHVPRHAWHLKEGQTTQHPLELIAVVNRLESL
jgi:hypothetical protein